MDKKQEIEEMFFKRRMTLTKISQEVNLSISYISRILKDNNKYNDEIEKRKNETKEKWKKRRKEIMRETRKEDAVQKMIENQVVKNMHDQAAREMSRGRGIGNHTLLKWCSVYKYNKGKKCYEFEKSDLLKPHDFPQYIKA